MQPNTGTAGMYDNTQQVRGSSVSAVSWAAVICGTVAATSMSLILFVLGTGLGMTSISPWSREGLEAETFGMVAVIWIAFTSIASAALGGYLAGRLRTKWPDVHRDEVFFRDTAHGFVTWGLSTMLMALFFASVTSSVVSTGARAVSSVAGGLGNTAGSVAGAAGGGLLAAGGGMLAGEGGELADTLDYYVDMLFRRDPGMASTNTGPGNNGQQQRNQGAVVTNPGDPVGQGPQGNGNQGAPTQQGQGEPGQATAANNQTMPRTQGNQDGGMMGGSQAPELPSMDAMTRIISRAYGTDDLSDADVEYLGRQVAYYADITQDEAEMRVRETYDQLRTELDDLETAARETADQARATTAQVSLWSFVALLAGAFVGSLSATWGGRQRDQ